MDKFEKHNYTEKEQELSKSPLKQKCTVVMKTT